MIDRRTFIRSTLATALLPWTVAAGTRADKPLLWADYLDALQQLASAHANRAVTQRHLATRATQLLQQLDLSDSTFQAALDASHESGNRFWHWQRLTKESTIKGGVLTIVQDQDVPLHDHPGATGMVRVLTGEVEVWQFDRPVAAPAGPTDSRAVLERACRRVMRPGDIATLSPASGNIHALRARSSTCSMLDYFIPPYVRSKRTWFQPVDTDWFDQTRILCRCIHENDFYLS